MTNERDVEERRRRLCAPVPRAARAFGKRAAADLGSVTVSSQVSFYQKGADVQKAEVRRRILAALWAVRKKMRVDAAERSPVDIKIKTVLDMAHVSAKTLRAPYHAALRRRVLRLTLQGASGSRRSPRPAAKPKRTPRTTVFKQMKQLAVALELQNRKNKKLEAELSVMKAKLASRNGAAQAR